MAEENLSTNGGDGNDNRRLEGELVMISDRLRFLEQAVIGLHASPDEISDALPGLASMIGEIREQVQEASKEVNHV